jgi:bifunctional non-homologous end joining protein LigD
MPTQITPMKATLATDPPKGQDWLFEVKWDGVRAICFLEGETIRLASRTGNRCERQYPELAVLPHYLAARQAILDGEIAVLDSKGVSRFELIQTRIHNTDPNSIAHLARSRPVIYFAFDLLYLDGYDLRKVDLVERKRILEAILTPGEMLRYSEHFAGAGETMLEAARENGLEGILAKHAHSCYEPHRSREWLKIKLTNEQDFLIVGFTTGERSYFGSLLLGVHQGREVVWVGNVGTGFDEKTLAAVHRKLQPLITSRSPLRNPPKLPQPVTWVKPELVCEVKFANWTQDQKLRAPVFLGLRDDVAPSEVVLEEAPAEVSRPEREALLSATQKEASLQIEGKTLKLTNLNKIFYPDEGYTKRDILNYYNDVADLILPHLKDRPLSLKRYPNGIGEDFFFQKDVPETFAAWLRTEKIQHDHNQGQGPTRYVFADDRASLLYLVNLGCIDHNPWMSRSGSLDNPDFVLIDLDPQDCPFEMITEAALLVKDVLDQIGLAGYPKTTGGDGMHVYIPIEPIYTYDTSRTFAEVLASVVTAERPKMFTAPRSLARREKGRVYFDYLQNGKSKTIAAPYVLRAYPGAPVATPLEWSEVRPGLTPQQFNLTNAMERFARVGDLFAGVLERPQRLEGSLEKLEKLLRKSR